MKKTQSVQMAYSGPCLNGQAHSVRNGHLPVWKALERVQNRRPFEIFQNEVKGAVMLAFAEDSHNARMMNFAKNFLFPSKSGQGLPVFRVLL